MYLLYLVRFGYLVITFSAICASTFSQLRVSILDYGKLNERRSLPSQCKDTWISTLRSVQVPKRWFRHFYLFGFLWNIWLLWELTGWLYFSRKGFLLSGLHHFDVPTQVEYRGSPEIALYALLLTQIQLTRRSYEVLFVEKPSNAKMHLGHYLVGLSFYLAVSLSVWLEATGNLGIYSSAPPKLTSAKLFAQPTTLIVSTLLFGYFSYRQYRCHVILSELRSSSKPHTRTPRYFIPRGDLFEYVTGGHYFSEIMIYLALWLLVGLSNITMGLAFAWVLINLGIVARETHRWYHETFQDAYPKHRKILLPYLY